MKARDYDLDGSLDTPNGFVVIADAAVLQEAGANPSMFGRMNDEVRVISAQEFSSRYPEKIRDDEERRIIYAAMADSLEVVGYLLVRTRAPAYCDEPPALELHIDQLAIRADQREQGIGSELVSAVVCDAEQMDIPVTAWVLRGSQKFYAAWRFYGAEPPAVPRDMDIPDAVYLRAESR